MIDFDLRRAGLLSTLSCLLLGSCSGSGLEREVILTNARTIRFCGDPEQSEPMKIGEFQIQIYAGELTHLDEDSRSAEFTAELTLATGLGELAAGAVLHPTEYPVRLSMNSGDPLELGSNTVEVFVDDCHFTEVSVKFFAEVIGRRVADGTLAVIALTTEFLVINECPPQGELASPPEQLVEAIVGMNVDGFADFGLAAPVGVPTKNSSPAVSPEVPSDLYTEVFQTGGIVVELSEEQLEAAFTGPEAVLANGRGDLALTVSSIIPAVSNPGLYLIAWQCVLEDTPLEGDVQSLQIGFVADRDGDSSNNYRTRPPFDDDPLDDTDSWFIGRYDVFSGWSLTVSDAQVFPPVTMPSATRMILFGSVQAFVIPVAELGDANEILARYMVLAHRGDFGAVQPWSGDVTPPVHEPLLPLPLDRDL